MLSKKALIVGIIGFLGVFFLIDHFGPAAISDWLARLVVIAVAVLFIMYRIGKHHDGYKQLVEAGIKVDGKPSLWASCYLASMQNEEMRYQIGTYYSIQRTIRDLPAGVPYRWGHLDAVTIYRTSQDLTRME
jgi:hypothetical protein